MTRSLAVTTDLSERAARPFATVAALARRWSAPLHVVHVCAHPDICMPWQVTPSADADSEKQSDVRAKLRHAIEREDAFTGVDVRIHVLAGRPEEEIRAFVEREDVGLIAMTTHGAKDLHDYLLGNLTRGVLQSVRCPVLVFPTNGGTQLPQSGVPRRLLAPFDFSDASREGLAKAFELARLLDARVRVLFVVEEIARVHERLLSATDSVANYFEEVRKEGARRLEGIVAEQGTEIEVDAVAHVGDPTSTIIEEARSFGADWIVLASRGASSLSEGRIGSVAERTLLGARRPVLIIPPAAAAAAAGTASVTS